MPYSTVKICNLGLGWLGAKLITSLEDDSTEAILCRNNFDLLRDTVLEARAWTFASKRNTLPVVVSSKPPEEVFGYSSRFKLPSDNIRVLKAGSIPSFLDRLQWVKEGDEILANTGKLYINYTSRVTEPTKFSASFCQTLAARIAADLCIALTENPKLQEAMWQLYMSKLTDAAASDGTQGRQERIRSDALIRPRITGIIETGPYV